MYGIERGVSCELNTLGIVLNMLLNSLPGQILRYRLFMDRLRVKKGVLFTGYTLLYLLQAGLFVLLGDRADSYRAIQVYKVLFATIFFLLPFFIIKIDLFANLFLYFLGACYSTVIIRIGSFIDLHFAGGMIRELAFFRNNLILIILFALTLPPVLAFYRRILKPAFDTAEPGIWRMMWIIPSMFFAFNVVTSGLFGIEYVESRLFFPSTLMTAGGMFVSCYVFLKVMRQTAETAALKESARQAENLLNLQGEQYRMMLENYENTRFMRHDFRQHLSVLKAMSDDGNMGGIQKYLSDYFSTVPETSEESYCKNSAVDAIVRLYVKEAKAISAEMTVNIHIPAETGINDAELCVIFGNCLKNAVEACGRLPRGEGFITVKAQLDGNILGITVDNSFNGEIRKDGDLFLSSKREGAGIGIASVRAVAKKYGGLTKFEARDGVFQASVLLSRSTVSPDQRESHSF